MVVKYYFCSALLFFGIIAGMPPVPECWVTLDEMTLILRLERKQVLKMVKAGILIGLIPDARNLNLLNQKNYRKADSMRIMHPGQQFVQYIIENDSRLLHIPLLSAAEVAEILGVKPETLTVKVYQKMIKRPFKTKYANGTYRFTVEEVRKIMASPHRAKRYGGRGGKCSAKVEMFTRMVEWGREQIAEKNKGLGNLIDAILILPSPEREMRIEMLMETAESLKALIQSPVTPEIEQSVVSSQPEVSK